MPKVKNKYAGIDSIKIIGVTQLKGGSGKSTVATNLAVELSRVGFTMLIDADPPQNTAECWDVIRNEKHYPIGHQAGKTGDIRLECAADDTALLSILRNADIEGVKYIVIDAPPRGSRVTKVIMGISDFILIPVNTSAADIWATYDTEELVNDEIKERKNVKARLLLNRFRNFTLSAHAIKKEAKKELSIPLLSTTLGFRVSYSEAMAQGKGVSETKDKKAQTEITKLTKEIIKLMR